MANNEVRIIGGQHRGRKLKFPDSASLRPTLGRVRETLFNWLSNDISNATCLDLFAGSGALGFEALSRGAQEVTFVEHNRKAVSALQRNAENLAAGNANIFCMTAQQFLRKAEQQWDIVFFDPPFDDLRALALLDELLEKHLADSGLIYLERPSSDRLPMQDRLVKRGTAGDCQFGLLARA